MKINLHLVIYHKLVGSPSVNKISLFSLLVSSTPIVKKKWPVLIKLASTAEDFSFLKMVPLWDFKSLQPHFTI